MFTELIKMSMCAKRWNRPLNHHNEGRSEHYLSNSGSQDITAQVILDQLPTELATLTQADFLKQWGIDQLVREGIGHLGNMENAQDVAAMKMRNRFTEVSTFTDNRASGGFLIIEFQSKYLIV